MVHIYIFGWLNLNFLIFIYVHISQPSLNKVCPKIGAYKLDMLLPCAECIRSPRWAGTAHISANPVMYISRRVKCSVHQGPAKI